MGVKTVKKVKTEIKLKPKPVITMMGDCGDLPYGSLLIGNQLINLKQAQAKEVLRAKVTKMNWTPGVVVPKEEYWRVKVVQRELDGLLTMDEKETAMMWRAKRREEMEAKRKAERAEQARKKAERRRKALERKSEEEAYAKAKMIVEARKKTERRRLANERKVEQTKLYIEKQKFLKERKEWRKGNRCICQEIGRPFDYRCIEHMLDREENMAKMAEMENIREVEAEERRKRLENDVYLAIERKVEETRRYMQKQAEKKEMRELQKGGKICMCKYGLQWDARCEQHAMENTGRMTVKQKEEAKTRVMIEKEEKKRVLIKEKDSEGRKRLLNQEKKDKKNIKIAQKKEKMSLKVEKKESEKADDIGTYSENGMHFDDKCDLKTICDNVHSKNKQDNCKDKKTEKSLFNFAHSLRKAFTFRKK